MKLLIILISLLIIPFNIFSQKSGSVKSGDEIFLLSDCNIIKGKNVALVTNHTAVLPDSTHFVDALIKKNICNIKTIFTPEHGFRGRVEAGNAISDSIDIATGVRLFSLYGKNTKPTVSSLSGIDLIIYDIQDVGARYYTYISTLFFILQAAAENNIKVIILDRVNPNSGNYIAGPTLKEDCKSFIGICKIPLAYGMTAGELALLMNGESFLGTTNKADIDVVKIQGWQRSSSFNENNLKWIAPSPNLQSPEAAHLYLGLGLLEGTNISEGRGTFAPFQIIGAPYIDAKKLKKSLDSIGTPGYSFQEITFIPKEIPGIAGNPKYKNTTCNGLLVEITDIKIANPYELGVKIIYLVRKLHSYSFSFNELWFDKLSGDKELRRLLSENNSLNEILGLTVKENEMFSVLRKKYLLYN